MHIAFISYFPASPLLIHESYTYGSHSDRSSCFLSFSAAPIEILLIYDLYRRLVRYSRPRIQWEYNQVENDVDEKMTENCTRPTHLVAADWPNVGAENRSWQLISLGFGLTRKPEECSELLGHNTGIIFDHPRTVSLPSS